jgi:hypothetical protein
MCLFKFGICVYTITRKPIFVLFIKRHKYYIEVRFPFLFSVKLFVVKAVHYLILTEATKINSVVRNMISCVLVEMYQIVWCHIPRDDTAIYLKCIP